MPKKVIANPFTGEAVVADEELVVSHAKHDQKSHGRRGSGTASANAGKLGFGPAGVGGGATPPEDYEVKYSYGEGKNFRDAPRKTFFKDSYGDAKRFAADETEIDVVRMSLEPGKVPLRMYGRAFKRSGKRLEFEVRAKSYDHAAELIAEHLDVDPKKFKAYKAKGEGTATREYGYFSGVEG